MTFRIPASRLFPVLKWMSRDHGHWSWAGGRWLTYSGQTRHEAAGLGWLAAIHPQDRPTVLTAWGDGRDRNELQFEGRIQRADGVYRWHRFTAVRMESQVGEAAWAGTCVDVDDLIQSRQRHTVLVDELQHRLRNIIAVVRSIANLTLDDGPARRDYDARLLAIARTQALSLGSEKPVKLAQIVQAELSSHAGGPGQISIKGDAAELPTSHLLPVALALHELATNAAKHGAFRHDTGRLGIEWQVNEVADGARCLVLQWRETGVPMLAGAVPARGFGRDLIEMALPYQLNAATNFSFTEDGVCCTISLELSGDRS